MSLSMFFVLGFAIGIIIVAVMFFLIRRKHGSANCKYDERQQLTQCKAFKTAFFVLLGYLCVTGLINLAAETEWCDSFTNSFIGICISVTVYAVICILNDAYISFQEKPVNYIILFSITALVNFAVAFVNFKAGTNMIVNGRLTFHAMNIIVGVMLVVVLAVFVVKLRLDAKNEPNDLVE